MAVTHPCPDSDSRGPHGGASNILTGFFNVSIVVYFLLEGWGKISGLKAWAGLALAGDIW